MFGRTKQHNIDSQIKKIGEAQSKIKNLNSDLTHLVNEYSEKKKPRAEPQVPPSESLKRDEDIGAQISNAYENSTQPSFSALN